MNPPDFSSSQSPPHSRHNPAQLVDFEPFTTRHGVVFAIPVGVRPHVVWLYAYFTATYADLGMALFEWSGPVIPGRNHNPPLPIRESVFFIDDGAHQSLRELISPIVDYRNALYDHPPLAVDVHPPVPGLAAVTEYLRQAMRIEFKLADILLRNEQFSLAVSQNALRRVALTPSEPAASIAFWCLDFGALRIGSL